MAIFGSPCIQGEPVKASRLSVRLRYRGHISWKSSKKFHVLFRSLQTPTTMPNWSSNKYSSDQDLNLEIIGYDTHHFVTIFLFVYCSEAGRSKPTRGTPGGVL